MSPIVQTVNEREIPLHWVCATQMVAKYLLCCLPPVAILFLHCVAQSALPVNLLAPSYRFLPPLLLQSPADVRQGRLVVPAVYLLPFRGFTWEATAQINSLNSHCSVGTPLPPSSPPCSFSLSASPSASSILSVCSFLFLSLSLLRLPDLVRFQLQSLVFFLFFFYFFSFKLM